MKLILKKYIMVFKETKMKESKMKILQSTWFLVLGALLCCALWGSATPFIKLGSSLLIKEPGVASTILFAGIRFTAAGIITVAIYSIARRKFLYPKRENLGRVGIVSLFQTVVQYIFFYIGLTNTTSVKGTIASGSSLFFAILISALVFRQEKLTVKKMLGCILGFAGIIVVNLSGLTFDMNFTGDGFVVISALSLGISSVLIKRFSAHEDPVVISGYQFVLGGALMVIIGLAFGGSISLTNARGVLILVYLSFLSAVAYSLWGVLLKYNPVSRVSIFSCTTPVFGVIFSWLLIKNEESVAPLNIAIALVLVCAGILVLNAKLPEKMKRRDE